MKKVMNEIKKFNTLIEKDVSKNKRSGMRKMTKKYQNLNY